MTDPASTPESVFVTTPALTAAVPEPPTEPAPPVCAKVTAVVLSEATVLPAASFTVAVTSRFEPDSRSAVEPVSAIETGVPGSIVKLVVSAPTPAAVAWIVIGPAVCAGDAPGGDAVRGGAAPSPVTVPVPAVFAKVTEVALSPARRLSFASRTSAVSVRAAPEARLAVELVIVRWSAAPGTTVKVVVPEVSPPAEAGDRDRAGGLRRDAPGRDAAGGGRGAEPGDGAGAGRLGEADRGRVVAGEDVVVRVPYLGGERARRAGGEVGGRAGDRQVVGRARDHGEGGAVRVDAGRGHLDRDRAGGLRRDAPGGDAARGGGGAEAGDGAGARRLGEGDGGRVVAGEEVVVCVAYLGGECARRAGGEAGGRAGDRQVVGGARDDGEGAGAGREPAGRGRDRDRAGGLRRDAPGGDAARGGRGAEPGDGAGAGRLGEADGGRVVAAEHVLVGVPHLGGQRADGAGGEVGRRSW